MSILTRVILLGGIIGGGVVTIGLGAMAQGTTQGTTQEVYQLTMIGGQALPVVTEVEGDCREEVLVATLTLESEGSWVLTKSERETCGDSVEADEEREEGSYTVEGATLRFLDDDGDPADDDDGEGEIDIDDLATGTRSGAVLTVRLADGRTDLEFRQ